MCGISCVLALNGTKLTGADARVNGGQSSISQQLDDSLRAINHRGPDAAGQWISDDGHVALGHCRLSIVDLSPDGDQPLHDEDNVIHAVVNGEIYQHEALRERLIRDFGYRFKGHSDSEVVVALYKHYGLSFLSHMRGEFSLCLYDSRTKSLVAARDRHGVKPLFWTVVDNRLLFAVEAKAFPALGWRPEWDVDSMASGGWYHDTRTIFKGVHKLRPGYYMTVSGSGLIEHQQYWDYEYRDKYQVETRTEAEMIAGVRHHLIEAVRMRLRADVPVGIYLSGGIDSSAIAGIVTHLVKEEGLRVGNHDATEKVCCFSIAFDEDSGFDESAIAKRTADWLDVKYVKKMMNETELATRFEDAAFSTEHPVSDMNFVGKFALSEEPRALGYKVVLTGEGSDEHFAGYPFLMPDFLKEADRAWPLATLPDTEREQLHAKHEDDITQMYSKLGSGDVRPQRCIYSDQVNNVSEMRFLTAFSLMPFAAWVKDLPIDSPRATIAHSLDGRTRDLMQTKWHPLHTALYLWGRSALPNHLLTCLGDRSEMAHSIEARPPFLDHHFAQYVNALPPSVKIRYDPATKDFKEKWILREATKPFITPELYHRKKHPYTAPLRWPEDGPLHKLFTSLVTRERVEKLGFVDWDAVKDDNHKAFVEKEPFAFRRLINIGILVVLSDRFGIPAAKPPLS